jgi:hypothetical protein
VGRSKRLILAALCSCIVVTTSPAEAQETTMKPAKGSALDIPAEPLAGRLYLFGALRAPRTAMRQAQRAQNPRTGPPWVDHVVTPVGAFGLMVAEDALDRFLVKWAERHISNRVWRASLRLIFNPARALSNTASGRVPWHRDERALSWK